MCKCTEWSDNEKKHNDDFITYLFMATMKRSITMISLHIYSCFSWRSITYFIMFGHFMIELNKFFIALFGCEQNWITYKLFIGFGLTGCRFLCFSCVWIMRRRRRFFNFNFGFSKLLKSYESAVIVYSLTNSTILSKLKT